MTGETEILNSASFTGEVVYIAHWPSPSGDRYVIAEQRGEPNSEFSYWVHVYDTNGNPVGNNVMIVPPTSNIPRWQHTLFNGGFHFIINSAIATPYFIADGGSDAAPLPNWASYAVAETVSDFIYNGEMGDFTCLLYTSPSPRDS